MVIILHSHKDWENPVTAIANCKCYMWRTLVLICDQKNGGLLSIPSECGLAPSLKRQKHNKQLFFGLPIYTTPIFLVTHLPSPHYFGYPSTHPRFFGSPSTLSQFFGPNVFIPPHQPNVFANYNYIFYFTYGKYKTLT